MNRSQWRSKIADIRRDARLEFAEFRRDYQLAKKPNLYAYCRYLRSYPQFVRNRLRAQRQPVSELLSGLLDPAIKAPERLEEIELEKELEELTRQAFAKARKAGAR